MRSDKKEINFNDESLASKQIFTDESGDYRPLDMDALKEVNISKYKDPEGLSMEKMKIGFWAIRNRGYFYSLVVGLFVLLIFSGWFLFLFTFGNYVFFGMKTDQNIVRNFLNNALPAHSFFKNNAAKPLNYGRTGYVETDPKKYDFYAQIINPNKEHWTEFKYYFSSASGRTVAEKGFVLPGETKYLYSLNQNIAGNIGAKPQLVIENLNWKRVNTHEFSKWRGYVAEYSDFEIDGKELIRSQSTNLSEKLPLNELHFNFKNKTAYNYNQVNFMIILFSGQEIVAINKYVANNVGSGEKREVKYVWPGKFEKINEIYIEPQVHIFDKGNFLDFK